MGLFKTMKDMKGLTDHHGGMPSIRGAFQDVASVADDRGEREVLKKGTPARAIAKGFTEPVPGDRFALSIPLEVHPPGGEPYLVQYTFTSARMKAPLTAGMEVPVKIHPDDPQRIAVQWDAQQAGISAAGGDMAAVMSGLQSTYETAANDAMVAAQNAAAAEDPEAKLRKLQTMRDAGLITEAELEAKRAEIIASM